MKVFIFITSLFFFIACTPDQTTTYYLIRHAEKDRIDKTNSNPPLNKKGLKRAERWSFYFKDIKLDAIYATSYHRTQQTAAPTAADKKLKVQSYDPNRLYDVDFKEATKGKTVLIVGHSNTTPVFANKIISENNEMLPKNLYPSMDDNDNFSLFVITINEKENTNEIRIVN
jgi:broad specificity phosphatase PhoE